MKKLVLILLLIGITFGQVKFKLEKLWETSQDLLVSESVLYDENSNIIYVACINGAPTEKNEKGFIAQISLDGKIIKQKWAKGLNAPKGMAIIGDKLFVNDIDRIAEIDLKTGEIAKFHQIRDAMFLNDIACNEKGELYASDSQTSKIFKLSDGNTEVFLSKGIVNPNGLLIDDNLLYIGNSGETKVLVYDFNKNKILNSVDVNSGIDGLKKVSESEFLISDWRGWTYIKDTKGNKIDLMNTTTENINSADLEFIKSKNIVLIPTFFDNRVVAYRLIKVESK